MEDHINILESNGDEEIGGNKLESTKDYQSMQMEFFDILRRDKQEEAAKATGGAAIHEENDEESELVSLSLGISSKVAAMDTEKKKSSNWTEKMVREENVDNEGLALGLDIRFEPSSSSSQAQAEATNNHSPKSSFDEEGKEEELPEMWPPSKVLKTTAAGDGSEAFQYTRLKEARVSIRARCDTQTMNDGCQWRKYGQKIAKGNPCPRSYYRCTVSSSCPVKKQVQRCAEDMSILITTYEGTHNHPLSSSATAMASTTSLAASMLQSPSLTSQHGLANSDTVPIINPIVAYNLNALRPGQLFFPISSISTSNFHPTITLDLTAPPTSSYLGKYPPGFSFTPKYSPTNLNFSSTLSPPLQSSTVLDSSTWNPYNGCFNYGGLIAQNRNQNGFLMNTGKQPFQGHLYQPNYMSNHAISQQPLSDSIASSTRAITANPKFQSALAAALTTYVANGAGGGGVRENHVGAESAALNLKLGGDMPYTKNTVHSSSQNGIGCASSKSLSVPSSAHNAQQGDIVFPLPQPSESSYSSSKKSNQFLEQRK